MIKKNWFTQCNDVHFLKVQILYKTDDVKCEVNRNRAIQCFQKRSSG